MAAYAAVVCLMKTIESILESSSISLVLPSPQVMQLAYKELKRLQEILERLDSTSRSKSRKKINALDGKIIDAVWKFEDLLESHLSDHILSQSDSLVVNHKASNSKSRGGQREASLFSIDMECPLNNLPDDEGEDEYIPSRINLGGMNSKIKSKMVGLSDEFEHAKMYLTRDLKWNLSYALVGMAGVGKTTLAKKIFEDPLIVSYFECRAAVTVGRKSRYNEILQNILTQVEPNISCRMLTEGDDEKIGEKLKERLEGKRCLILLDDVWDTEVTDYLRNHLPDLNDGMVRVLLTTRRRIVAELMAPHHYRVLRVIKFLNEEESTYLLRLKVFGEDDFPYQLEKPGKKIAKNCEGLPLLIVTIANHLSNAEKTAKYWNEVAEKQNSVFTDAYNEIAKVLFPSYDYLPQYLKMFFLYMGAFPPDYEIPPSKLINMLTVEGFLEPYKAETIKGHVLGCLEYIL